MSLNLISSLSFLKSRLGGGGKGPAPLFTSLKAAAATRSIDLYGGVTESDLESSSSESEEEEEEEEDLEQEAEDNESSRYVVLLFSLDVVIISVLKMDALCY